MKSMTRIELDRLLAAAKSQSFLDYLMILVTFQHGLRVSETLSLTRQNIEGDYIVVPRLKRSNAANHPLLPNEREFLTKLEGRFFNMDRTTFWRRMQKYGAMADIPSFLRHPHALKHTCGKLGFKGGMTIPEVQAYLGHKNGGNTLIYMQADEREAAAAFAAAVGR
jgi:integrase